MTLQGKRPKEVLDTLRAAGIPPDERTAVTLIGIAIGIMFDYGRTPREMLEVINFGIERVGKLFRDNDVKPEPKETF